MLKVSLNLSSNPFVNNRRFYLVTSFLFVLLVAVSYWNLALRREVHSRRVETDSLLIQRTKQLQRMIREEKEIKARLLQPQTADFLDTIEYINRMIERKVFSWTTLLNDLEQLAPKSIQVVSIRPRVVKNEFGIEITANARNTADYIQFVTNLENSDKFQNLTPIYEDLSKTPGFSGKQISIAVKYKR